VTILESLPLQKPSDSTDLFQTDSRAAREQRKRVASWALNSWQTSKTDRSKQERQWYINLAFYFGQHYVKYRGSSITNYDLYVPTAPYYKVRPVINYVRKFVRKDIASVTSQKPSAYAVPASSEDNDLFAAQAAEQVWESTYHRCGLHKKYRQAIFWAEVCGNGFFKQWWNEDKDDPDNPNKENPDQPMGDLDYTAESPFHIFVPDLLAQDIEHQPWTAHAKQVDPEWVEKEYGVKIAQDAQSADVINRSFLTVMDVNASNRGKLTLLEFCVKPGITPLLPDGGYFTLAGSNLIYGGEGPLYSHGEYPYSKIDAMPSGKFYSDSVIVDLIPLQRELNRTVGQVIEAKNRMAKPQLLAQEGSIDPTKMTTEPGQVIFVRAGHDFPQPLPLQSLPSYVLEQIDRDLSFMSDLSGQHEVSKGQVPPGVTAATAISYLQEADDSIRAEIHSSIEESYEKTARQSLTLVKDYWSTERLVKVTGTDGTFDALMLKGSDINYDIRMEGGSSLPTSKAARQAFVMDLMTRGFVDPDEGLSVMDMGGLTKIYDRIQVDIKQVQRENVKLKNITEEMIQAHIEDWQSKVEAQDPVALDPDSQMAFEAPPIIPVNSYDNHQMHIEYHNRYRKSQAFEMLEDWQKAVFEEHVSQHEEVLMSLQTPDQLQGVSPLTPPGEGGSMESEQLQPPSEGSPGQPGPEPMPEQESEEAF
jgi:hypothetical protein